jgi:hypothetical protein
MAALEKARLAAEILLTYARARWLLRRGGLPGAVESLRQGPSPRGDGGALDESAIWRYAHAVAKVLRPLPTDSRCLVRSLVLLAVLARRRTQTVLVLGVQAEPRFAAHCWVEHRGVPVLAPGPAGQGRLLEL